MPRNQLNIPQRLIVVTFLSLMPTFVRAAWRPPADPNPQEILNSAVKDRLCGRYEEALDKLIWFRANSLDINPALYGVRNSFALSYWKDLADVFPPALTKLRKERDAAVAAVQAGQGIRSAFTDAQSLNDVLGDEESTKQLFVWLDKNKPDLAVQVYDVAEETLVSTHDYSICGKYLRPEESLKHYIEQFNERLDFEKSAASKGKGFEFAEPFFINRVATLVALLVRNGKPDLASQIASEAKRQLNNEAFERALAAALKGDVPDPWPPH